MSSVNKFVKLAHEIEVCNFYSVLAQLLLFLGMVQEIRDLVYVFFKNN